MFVRVKCTVTERGRMVNLKQAGFKPLKLTGLARCMPESEEGRVTSAVWLGVARVVCLMSTEAIPTSHCVPVPTVHPAVQSTPVHPSLKLQIMAPF